MRFPIASFLLAHQPSYGDRFLVEISTRVELKSNRFALLIRSERNHSFSDTARMFRPTIGVVVNAARIIDLDAPDAFRFLNRVNGNTDRWD